MIPAVDIRHDLGRLSANLGLMAKDRQAAALRAINRTLSTVRAESSRTLAEDLTGLKIGAIKKRIRLDRATRAKLRGVLEFSNKRLRLFNWNVPQVRTPWGTGIRTSGRMPKGLLRVDAVSGHARPVSAAELRSAFVQRARLGRAPNIWLRQGKHSMPIDVIVTPSLSEILVQRRLNEAFARRARERFSIVFAQEARFRLSRR